MSKVTIFANGVSGGGAERVICELSGELVDKGWDIDLITMSDDKASFNLSDKVIRFVLLKGNKRAAFLKKILLRYKALKLYIKKEKTDVFVVFLPHTTIFLLSMKKYIKVPIIVAERSNPERYPRHLKILLKIFANRADGFVFQTEASKSWYGKLTYNKQVSIIPNAINRQFLKNINGEIRKKKEIVSVGRLHVGKNFEMLIDVFSDIADDYPDYSLTIYGKGPEETALKEKICKLNLEKRINLPGFSTNIREALLEAKLFVFTSDYEGMPNALMEAMACGLPCISTDFAGGAAKILIEDGKNGLIVPVGDRVSMADAIRRILDSNDLADYLANNAIKIKEQLAPEIIYDKWEQILNDVMSR